MSDFGAYQRLVVLLLAVGLAASSRVKDQITIRLTGGQNHCFRLLNGTTAVGCQSARTGNIGAVAAVSSEDDVEDAIKRLPLGISGVIAAVNASELTAKLVDALRRSEDVQGILIFAKQGHEPASFSEDGSCPEREFSIYKQNASDQCQWNQKAAVHPSGLRFLSFDKPVYLLTNDTEVEVIVERCSKKFNQEKSSYACMAKMTQFMFAAGSAQVCQRRQSMSHPLAEAVQLCDPLRDRNVFAVVPPVPATAKADILTIATRLDTFSTFTESRGGDLSVLPPVIALLAVADAIGKNQKQFVTTGNKNKRQVMLSFFHGESLGYVGSSRMVYDMENLRFPASRKNFSKPELSVRQLTIDDISTYIEVQQISDSPKFFFHVDKDVYFKHRSTIVRIVEACQNASRGVLIERASSRVLPPSSYYSLLKHRPIPGFVLANFDQQYRYGVVNSIFDDGIRHDRGKRTRLVQDILNAAKAVLGAAVDHVYSNSSSDFSISREYIEKLVDCFYYSAQWDCALFTDILQSNTTRVNFAKARDMYIGTTDNSLTRMIVNALLVQSLGETAPASNVFSEEQCYNLNKNQNVYTFVWQFNVERNISVCYRTSVYVTEAKSPAFEIPDYEWESGTYSTWMESVWESSEHRMELFLRADAAFDFLPVVIAILFVLCMIPVWWFFREQWFMDNTVPPASPQQL
ncbi:Protein APH-2 a [Aphelenchoides avenae]|nr:Protein APH-2 a [Aphelenchus avenae]